MADVIERLRRRVDALMDERDALMVERDALRKELRRTAGRLALAERRLAAVGESLVGAGTRGYFKAAGSQVAALIRQRDEWRQRAQAAEWMLRQIHKARREARLARRRAKREPPQ